MKNYVYQNILFNKKQLKELLAWSFSRYDSMQASLLADELKYLGFKYATQAGISISIEDLKVPPTKNVMLKKANKNILNAEKICLKGKITDVERFQKIIETWSLASESLKNNIVTYFKTYDPLNSVYIMAFSGARGNLSQVRQLVGMRGLMADPSGEIMGVPIKKNFREGLTITDYLISGYGARKGIIDTALKTANSGYLTRRLIDVAQDIIIREKDCLAFVPFSISKLNKLNNKQFIGTMLAKPIHDLKTQEIIVPANTYITLKLLKLFEQKQISKFYIRSPLNCILYRSICQMCYGQDLSNQNLVDLGEAVGILAGQSIGEPGTQLTMRTFHTGGTFTSQTRKQIISPITGIVKFSKRLKTITLRTNRGDDVLVTKNSGLLALVPQRLQENIIQIELFRNTMLFVKSNQYVKKLEIIGELISNEKKTVTEKKPIFSLTAGEVFMPKLKIETSFITQNRLLWILSGQVYQVPINSFLNFYTDHKINKNSYIFRTKLINQYPGYITSFDTKKNVGCQKIQIINNTCLLENAYFQKIRNPKNQKNYLINWNNSKYLVELVNSDFKNFKRYSKSKFFALSVNNNFKTLTGGIIFHNQQIKQKISNKLISYNISYKRNIFCVDKDGFLSITSHFYYYLRDLKTSLENLKIKLDKNDFTFFQKLLDHIERQSNLIGEVKRADLKNFLENLQIKLNKYDPTGFQKSLNYIERQSNWIVRKKIIHNSVIWLSEETYKLNCNKNILLVENDTLISKNFEILPNLLSKTEGIITFLQKNNIVEEIRIKAGLVYQGESFEQLNKNVYYPGELIFDNIEIVQPSLCENVTTKSNNQLLIRPFTIYEIPKQKNLRNISTNDNKSNIIFKVTYKTHYLYKTHQKIKTSTSINLISRSINLIPKNSLQKNITIDLSNSFKRKGLNLKILENFLLNQYIPAHLKYTNLQWCLLFELSQFIDTYTILGYFEVITENTLEIVKFKSKRSNKKQVLLISNRDCVIVKKQQEKKETINQLIVDNIKVNQTGKVLIDNGKFLTIQKGRPYLFPNCKVNNQNKKSNLQYRTLTLNRTIPEYRNNPFLNYYDITKQINLDGIRRVICSKIVIKNNGQFYTCSPIPLFLNNFSVTKENPLLTFKNNPLVTNEKLTTHHYNKVNLDTSKFKNKINVQDEDQFLPLLFKSSDLISNKIKKTVSFNKNLTSVIWKSKVGKKIINVHSLTEDYFEQEVNNFYCKDGEFIEKGKIIGLLNFEKEITGDIIQGLPRVEELLEARKKQPTSKYLAISKKKSLVIKKTSIDSNFDFRKLGTTIQENDKINPHNLLKVYFNYYAMERKVCSNKKQFTFFLRLANNYEASYQTFKKIQLLILNSVQSVYQSQGVSIANKHLEVIIKQMTTNVCITYKGHTALLPHEMINLYHIKHINQVVNAHNKRPAYYLPILLGITKSALNSPSFISAASFQETIRVLTKAAIEGRVDWLRGLKENIIIGHLIPSGTSYPNYTNCFNLVPQNKTNLEKIKNKI